MTEHPGGEDRGRPCGGTLATSSLPNLTQRKHIEVELMPELTAGAGGDAAGMSATETQP